MTYTEDKFNRQDILQSIAGASVGILSTFVVYTKTAQDIQSAISLFMAVVLLVILSIQAFRPRIKNNPSRLFLYVITALVSSYIISFGISLAWEGIPIQDMFSTVYFQSVGFVAMLVGTLSGAITDVKIK